MSDEATTRPPATTWSGEHGWPATYVPPLSRPLTAPISDTAALQLRLLTIVGGLIAQGLFFGELLGFNVVVWAGFVLAAALVTRRRDVAMDRLDWWLPGACLAFAAFVAVRGDGPLTLFNTLVALALLLSSVTALRGVAVTRGSWRTTVAVTEAVAAIVLVGAARLGGGFRPLRGLMTRQPTAMRVVVGLLLALPLVVLFGALFSAADAIFATQLGRVLAIHIALDELVGRALAALLAGWLLAGVLLVAWLTDERLEPRPAIEWRRRLGIIEGCIALFAVDALFAIFVVVQGAYLFGGVDTLAASGLTYSEYARRGFFELIAVAVLAGLVVFVLDALIERRTVVYRAAAVGLAVLTGAVLVSAVARLSLYQQAYGWTELRFYALLAIVWLGVGVLALAGGLVLDRLRLVPLGLLLAALALALALGANVVGPQRFVTEQNVARATDPSLVPADGWSGFDAQYLYSLGHEAVPVLVDALPRLPADVRADVDGYLEYEANRLRYDALKLGWPSFNLARARALDALSAGGY